MVASNFERSIAGFTEFLSISQLWIHIGDA
jgi:hypothetical protein